MDMDLLTEVPDVQTSETEAVPYTPDAFPDIPVQIREFFQSEFKGGYPNIPLPPEVSVDALRETDPDPFFITLPIMPIGIVSANKLRYTLKLARSITEQINRKRSFGIRGHLTPEERASKAPVPEVYWLAAEIVGDKVWAKGYVPPGDTRNDLRVRKSVGMKVATSFYGKPVSIKEFDDGTYEPELDLEQVDIAEVGRAAHGEAYEFAITSEMADSAVVEPETQPVSEVEEEKEPTMDDIRALLSEMADDALYEMCGDERMGRLADMYGKKNKKKMVASELDAIEVDVISELRTDASKLPAVVAELETLRAEHSKLVAKVAETEITEAIRAATDWNVISEQGVERLGKLRTALQSAAVAEMAVDGNAVEAVNRALAANGLLMETTRDLLAGPGLPVTSGKSDNEELDIESAMRARARMAL